MSCCSGGFCGGKFFGALVATALGGYALFHAVTSDKSHDAKSGEAAVETVSMGEHAGCCSMESKASETGAVAEKSECSGGTCPLAGQAMEVAATEHADGCPAGMGCPEGMECSDEMKAACGEKLAEGQAGEEKAADAAEAAGG